MANDVCRHVEEYRQQGYAVVRGVFGTADLAPLSAAFDRHYAAGLKHPGSFRDGNALVRIRRDPQLGRIVPMVQWPSYADAVLAGFRTDRRLLDLLAPLIGTDIKQIVNQMHWKPPGAAAVTFAWHQDARFRRPRECYRNLGSAYVQTGIAVDPHTAGNGAMKVLPGSHLRGDIGLAVAASVLGGGLGLESLERAGLDPGGLVDLELAPGDVALWSPYLVHGSGSNRTAHDRRFLINGYVRAGDCDRGEWAWRGGVPCTLGTPVLVHYDQLHERPEPHYVEE